MDDLYDLIELGKDTPLKYFFCQRIDKGYIHKNLHYPHRLSALDSEERIKMTLQQKLLRKFYYENSGFTDELAIFAEISNKKLAKKVGIDAIDDLVLVQNVNDFGSMTKENDFKEHSMKVLNLEI